FSSSGY
ncbi:hypothetical protein ECPA34_2850, partial [Escherichia coli PA34]